MNISLSPFASENLVSREGFSRSVPRQFAHLHTQAESSVYLRDSSRFPRWRPFIYLYRQTTSGRSRDDRVTHLRTDDVHFFLESAGTEPVVFKVVRESGAVFSGFPMSQFMCHSLFLAHTHYWYTVDIHVGYTQYRKQSGHVVRYSLFRRYIMGWLPTLTLRSS